mgnify:CR=1 FL=1
MADIINQPRDVREAQEFLRRIAFSYDRIPLIAVDGVFGSETTGAVRTFQLLFGLPVTGMIDHLTWIELSRLYQELRREDRRPHALFPFRQVVLLVPGDTGDHIYILQIMLNTLSLRYHNIPPVPQNGLFDEATERAVRAAQDAFSLEQTGTVDRQTWDLLARSYNEYVGR